ncbi:hypothetical protein [Parasedimentitalea huanghaiensis]|uniref:Uncharacterized protein n=1 Tax=Parasedimentitalea huanghaiensis TaxID=2682100 RepID=A0A6L6WRF0_9RHOB|nr:hypothetical protein [Zongyanglinia huanghaiensis]MVO18507.1 hypothetical protein [Zongyanglinia huanghaiensis]
MDCFFDSEKDFGTLPKLASQVIEATKGQVDENSSLARVVAQLGNGRALSVQINYLERSVHGIDWHGCVAAIDIASLAYQNTSIEIEAAEDACKIYMATTNEY